MAFRFHHHLFHNASAAAAISFCIALCLPFLAPARSAADNLQKFDLDINELKQRGRTGADAPVLPPASRKRALPAKAVQKQGLGHSVKKAGKGKNGNRSNRDLSNAEEPLISVQSQEKLQLLKKLPSPGFIPTPSQPKTVKLLASDPPCELIPRILVDFLSPIPTAEVIKDVRMEVLHAVRGNMITAAITCNLADSEEKEMARQLAGQGTRLINITASDSPETVVNKIAGALGYSTQTVRATLDNVRLVYVFPAGGNKENGIFFSIGNSNATAPLDGREPGTAVK